MEGNNWILYEDGKLTVDEFFNQLVHEFPSLESEVEDAKEYGEHFMMMEVFATYTVEQFENNNFQELKRSFQFIENRLENVKDEVINALNVSYCESIIDKVRNKDIQNYMGIKFRKFYQEYEEYWYKLNS